MSFCVKCGRDCEESLNGLCIDCWLDGRSLTWLPHHVDLKVCTNCGEFMFGERWRAMDVEDAVKQAARDALDHLGDVKLMDDAEFSLDSKDPYVYTVTITSKCDVLGYMTEHEASTIVRIKNNVCRRCSRQLGSYYEAILQLRTGAKGGLTPEQREEALAFTEDYVYRAAQTNKSLFITKMEMVTGGVDVYLSSISLGKNLAKEFSEVYCAETKESPKLVGQTTDGQDMYRLTYLVRLPEYHVGDVVIHEGRYCKLIRVSGNGGRVLDLMNFREKSVRKSDMTDIKLYEKAADLKEATVVSSSGSEIQVLHPDNYSTIDLRVPEGYETGDSVQTVIIDDVLYLVP